MQVVTYSSFGYESPLVSVECDIRLGISAIDIIGISDSLVGEVKDRVKAN